VARTRTTKKLAQRIDLNYFKRPTPFKRAQALLSIAVPLVALGWLAWHGLRRDLRVYSSGRMSEAHAVLERQCGACHVERAGEFSSNAADSACLVCHDGPAHHENQIASAVPSCATCHAEHRGRIQLSAASDQSCAECHGHLKVASGQVHYAARIYSLEDGHPEFAALRDGAKDSDTIKLNHAIHMKPIRQGPKGPIAQLECGDCHRPEAVNAPWPYEDADYMASEASYFESAQATAPHGGLSRAQPRTGRETMMPVRFGTACAGCHLLTFDKRFEEGVPHDKTEIVHAFVVAKFQEYIAAHPEELRVVRDPKRDLTGKPIPPDVRVLTPAQFVAERTAAVEELLWRKTCKQCHAYSAQQQTVQMATRFGTAQSVLPTIADARVTVKWLPHARFDHDAHRGFNCVSCHAKALHSTESSDVLVPGIATCKTCHAPGPEHAESRCFECHTYHDWAKRKEVKATFTPPELERGGR
jgi:hypothetical protein